ncbi:MAG: tetratricopeptide repeat protein [Bdellovibrionales bacterium]
MGSLEPGGINANTCKVVEQMVKGQKVEATTLTNSTLENASSAGPPPVAFYYLKAVQLTDPRDAITAIGYVRSAQELQPQWMRAFSFEAELQMRIQKFSNAANLYTKILNATNNRHTVSQISLGVIEYRNFNRIERAYNILQPLLSQPKVEAPTEILSRGYLALAEISTRYRKSEEALAYCKKSYATDPTNAQARDLCVALGGKGAVANTNVDVRSYITQGDQFFREGQLEAATSYYQTAYQLDTTSAIAAMKAGKSLWALSMSQEAITWINRAIKADPKLIEAYVTLSEYYALKYDFISANKILEKANSVSPNSFEVYYGLANVQYLQKNYSHAINYGQKALKLYQADTKTHILMAKAYLKLQEYNKAYASANSAVELDSNDREAQVTLASALAGIQGVSSG